MKKILNRRFCTDINHSSTEKSMFVVLVIYRNDYKGVLLVMIIIILLMLCVKIVLDGESTDDYSIAK